MTRRQTLLCVWFIALVGSGYCVYSATGVAVWGLSVSFAVLGISLGVPLMRAFTEHSK